MMTLIDTHAHLEQIEDLAHSLEQARAAGVEAIVAVGVDLSSNQRNLEIQRQFRNPPIHVALGIHPGNIKDEDIEKSLRFIEEHVSDAIAIGEIGLDFWYKWARKNEQAKDFQKQIFRRQLVIAQKNNKPVIIHSRGAWKTCLEMVQELDMHDGVFHWYSGPADILKEILAQGFYISATPSLAYSPQAREAASAAPVERLLFETDSPVFYKDNDQGGGFSARPKDVFRTLELYAQIKMVAKEEAALVSSANARRLFRIKDLEKGIES